MADAPLIGITMRLEQATRRFYLGRDYCEAVRAAGGVPVHIPLIADAEYVSEVISSLNGVLLPGCDSDPDPALYGEDLHPKLGDVIPEKDATDLAVIAEAERCELPILGICYGMQILNVARGGSLIQDIGSEVDDAVEHQQGVPRERNTHRIRIEKGSLLESLTSNGAGENAMVNSHHHQAVKRVGNELKATAWAEDGVIEAIEDARDGKFVLGVQWHPELSWHRDERSASIFREFVDECRNGNLR